MVDPLLQELQRDSRVSAKELAELYQADVDVIEDRIKTWEENGTILGYQAVVDPDRAGQTGVTALIEVRLTPERDGGFDRIARRISNFPQVSSCYLMSGGYDLAIIVEGEDLRQIAEFVAQKLSTIGAVTSTATRFQLKAYKQNGFLAETPEQDERLPVSP